ncbi:MAG: hypothetical protein K8R40_02270 [Anaerolineaceae bacterium]|nr:hypothetical protein [Anaerolineaceae bacterium]
MVSYTNISVSPHVLAKPDPEPSIRVRNAVTNALLTGAAIDEIETGIYRASIVLQEIINVVWIPETTDTDYTVVVMYTGDDTHQIRNDIAAVSTKIDAWSVTIAEMQAESSLSNFKASDVLLSAARLIEDAIDSEADAAGTTTTIKDSTLTIKFQEGAILFLKSGDNDGKVRKLKTMADGTLTLTTALDTATADGDDYVICEAEYDLMMNAARVTFGTRRYMDTNDTLIIVADQEFYDLPDGVIDVRRVSIGANSSDPLDYYPHHYWDVVDGQLKFRDYKPQDTGNIIRLHYAGRWSFDPEAVMPESLARFEEYLAWSICWNYLRAYVRRHKTDDPIALQFANEAGQRVMQLPKPRLDNIAIKYSGGF